jgi:hypothetical protein
MGDVPGSAPRPWQVEQISLRVISISFSTPKIASSKFKSTLICKSAPRWGALRERRVVLPNPPKLPKISSKISEKSTEVKSDRPSPHLHDRNGQSSCFLGPIDGVSLVYF